MLAVGNNNPNVVAEHGQACAIDCVDQTCRSVGYQLKAFGDLAVEKANIGVTRDIRDDFYELANFYSEYGFSECVSGYADAPVSGFSVHRISKEGQFDVGEFLSDARADCDDNNPSTACELPGLKVLRVEWILELAFDLACDVGLSDTEDDFFPGWHATSETCDGLSVNDDFVFPWDMNPGGGGLEFKIAALEDAGGDVGLRYAGEGTLAVAPSLSAQLEGEDPLRYLPHLVGDGTLRVDWDRAQGEVGGVSWAFPAPPFDPTHLALSLIRLPDDCSSGSQPLAVDVYLEDDDGDVARAQAQNFSIESASWPGNPSSCSNEERYSVLVPLSCFEESAGVLDPAIMTGLQLRFGDGNSTASGAVLVDSVALVRPASASSALSCSDLGPLPRVLGSYSCSDYALDAFASYVPTVSPGSGDPVGELTLDGALGRFLAARPNAIAECDGTEYRPDTAAGFDVRSLRQVQPGSLFELLGLQDGDAAVTVNEPGKPASNAVELYDEESFLVAIRRFGALEDLDVSFLREDSGVGYRPVTLGATIPADLAGVSGPERPAPPATYTLPGTATTVSTSAALVTELASPVGHDIILVDGAYDWTGPVTAAGPHRLWSQSLHGAVVSFGLTYAGNADRTGGLELHGLSFELDDASMAPFGVGTSHVLYTWGQGGEDVLVEDCAFGGDLAIGNGIGAYAPNGLVVRRSTFDSFWANAVFAKQGAAGTVLSSEPLLEDLSIHSVFDVTPGSSGGARENGILLGNNATVQRVDIRDVGWSGIQLYNDATGVSIRDAFVDYAGPGVWASTYTDPRGAGLWLSESHDVTIERVRVESHSFMGVNLVWDGGSGNPFTNTTPPRNHHVLISDLYSRAYKIGVHMDFGVEDCSVRSSRFEHAWMAGVLDNNRFEDDWGWYSCAGGEEVCVDTTNRVDNIDCYLEDGADCVGYHHHGGASSTPPPNWATHPDGYLQPGGLWNRDDAASSASSSGGGGGGASTGSVDSSTSG